MHLFINSLAASAGGGLTYIRNVIPHLAATPEIKLTLALGSGLRQEFQAFPDIEFLENDASPVRRFWYEQATLPGLVQRSRADVLLSAGNFALRDSPVPQILLSRNSIYTSRDFYRDLLSRHEYRLWIDTHVRGALAKRSIHWADVTVAPSQAFANDLRRWTGAPVRTIYHGFDHNEFFADSGPLAPEVEQKLLSVEGCLRLLFVSHYNYYRNFETLLRSVPYLRQGLAGRPVKLLLTCKLPSGEKPGGYNPELAGRLVKELGIAGEVVELGPIPYRQLHLVHRRSDIYVTPAYTETFAHPLVEAMASGLPIVASDLDVHREICGDAALYFPRFSPKALAESVLQAARPETSESMAAFGRERSRQFSWKAHVEKILDLSDELVESRSMRTGGAW